MTYGTVGYFGTVAAGMVQLDGQAVRVVNTTANTFDLQGLNTTNLGTWSGSAQFIPVATWATLAEADGLDKSGGAADRVDVTCLIDTNRQEENGNLAAQSYTINIKTTDVPTAALAFLEAQAQAGALVVMRVTVVSTGAVRVFRGEPSMASESLQVGGVGSGSIGFAVKGLVLAGAA
jgi:hypothetical protein